MLPIFLVVVFGVVDFGRAVFNYNTLAEAAREGARVASVQADWIGESGVCRLSDGCPANTGIFRARVEEAVRAHSIGLGTVPSADILITCFLPDGSGASTDCAASNDAGGTVRVEVRFPYTLFRPIAAQFVGPIDLRAQTTMTIT